ncbi:MAG: VRR-NUC domain-containing protein [Oscillospiraceae bacterium]
MEKVTLPTVSESVEQISLFSWAIYAAGTMPELELLHHIPNGGKRDITTAKRLKAEGVKAGVPDISLPVPSGRYHGLYIELKVGKNKTTDNQNGWIDKLQQQGYCVAVCYGWEAASKIITQYLKQPEKLSIGGKTSV